MNVPSLQGTVND